MYSKFSNCRNSEADSNPYSNILSITSKRVTANKFDSTNCLNVTDEQIEHLYDKLSEIQNAEQHEPSEDLSDYTVTYIANLIEKKIKLTKNFSCLLCKQIFCENPKKTGNASSKTTEMPCYSTFCICKQTERFLKIDLLKGSFSFDVIYHEILQNLNFDTLYDKTDFSQHFEHKIFLVRYIVDEFIRIRGVHMARTATLKEHKKSLRIKLHKLLHYLGQ